MNSIIYISLSIIVLLVSIALTIVSIKTIKIQRSYEKLLKDYNDKCSLYKYVESKNCECVEKIKKMEKEKEAAYNKPFVIERSTIPFKTYTCKAIAPEMYYTVTETEKLEISEEIKSILVNQLAKQIIDDAPILISSDTDVVTLQTVWIAEIYVGFKNY